MVSTNGLAIAFVVILVSSFVQGLAGFGFSLIAVPLLSLLIPINTAVPVIVCLSLVINLQIMIRLIRSIELEKIWLLIVAGLVGVPIGGYLLVVVNPNVLRLFVGIVVAVFAASLFLRIGAKIKSEKAASVLVGLISGILNGSISLSGPPIVLFLSNQGKDKDTFKGNLMAYAFILNVWTIIAFSTNGIMTAEVLRMAGSGVLVALIGVYGGLKMSSGINEQLFRKLVLAFLLISSLWTAVIGYVDLVRL